MNFDVKINETFDGLKDFQRKTVDYVYNQLYSKEKSKMLIADEVGLGKTIVAKGIIAKAYKEFKPKRKKDVFNVVYICSNRALARQNIRKLNFTGDRKAVDYSGDEDRLTDLAYISNDKSNTFPFKIKAFTPATSFNSKTHAGKSKERILLYRLLYQYADINPHKNSLKWILIGNRLMGKDNWDSYITDAEKNDKRKYEERKDRVRPKVFSEFKKALEKKVKPSDMPKSFAAIGINYEIKYWTLLKKLCKLKVRKDNYKKFNFNKELISSLRFILSRVCLEFLEANIFILDEFQRYKQLIEINDNNSDIDKVSPAIQIAKDIFSFEGPKTLMLSATPFKPYTNDFDELNGEDHYKEFKTVLQFLIADKTDAFWDEYEKDRKVLFSFLRHPDKLNSNIDSALNLKNKLESFYRSCMVRTEKMIVSNDLDALINHRHKNSIDLQIEDVKDFILLDKITQVLNKEHKTSLNIPVEYVKSCPFPLSYLDNYQHKEKLRKIAPDNPNIIAELKKTKNAWLDFNKINHYKPLIPNHGKKIPNAKLRLLLDESVLNNGWKLLWIPPSIPYYEFEGAYKNNQGFSKTLIFSSWKMVPRMISSLVSYEAERLTIGNPNSISMKEKTEEERLYFKTIRSPRPQFTFKVEKDEDPKQMNNFILSFPCIYLAKIYDPANNIALKKTSNQIKQDLKNKLIQEFNSLNLNQYVTGKGDWKKWYWLAPLLLDKTNSHNELMFDWFSKGLPSSELSIDADNFNDDKEESKGKTKHFEKAKSILQKDLKIDASILSNDQIEIVCKHLADLAIGSPAVCFLRSLMRYKHLSLDLLDAAFNVASAFYTMLNKPESISIIRIHTKGRDYWKRSLQYMIDGNIQSMLDEFVFLLYTGEQITSVTEMSDFISDILSVRTVRTVTDNLSSFLNNMKSGKKKRKRSLRSHYAADFGTQKINSANGNREINVRQAFNSPFRPFVLASTSIGQEGLDFHLYCKKIFHWNLPSNPIDFEQREGRIHRYQGLVIRKNLADKYQDEIQFSDDKNKVWPDLFEHAKMEKQNAKFPCDLVPFWHTETKSDIKIERFVPLYPFSKDIEKFNNLIKILTYYRLTFGQPRQDELVEALNNCDLNEDILQEINSLIIDLSPIKFS
jgi:hypothetical protein